MAAAPPQTALEQAYAHCFDVVRGDDHERWLASLFWPAHARPHAHALLAFDAEIGKIPGIVSEPMLGEIRFQWWRDAIAKRDAGGNPLAEALLDTVERFNLDVTELLALIEARSFDLYDDPMPSEAALENYCRDTTATIFEAIARVLAPGRVPSPAVDAAGRAYRLTMLLRDLPFHVMRGRLFLPLDLLALHGAAPETVLAHRALPELDRALAALRVRARMHLGEMRASLADGGAGIAACLPAALCGGVLRRMERRGFDPFATPIDVPTWRQQLTLWRMARSF